MRRSLPTRSCKRSAQLLVGNGTEERLEPGALLLLRAILVLVTSLFSVTLFPSRQGGRRIVLIVLRIWGANPWATSDAGPTRIVTTRVSRPVCTPVSFQVPGSLSIVVGKGFVVRERDLDVKRLTQVDPFLPSTGPGNLNLFGRVSGIVYCDGS